MSDMKELLKKLDSINPNEDIPKVKETLITKSKVSKKMLTEDEKIKVEKMSDTKYDNSSNGLKEYKLKEEITETIADIYEKYGTIRGAYKVKKLRESLKQLVNNNELWNGAGAKREWHVLEDELRNEMNKFNLLGDK